MMSGNMARLPRFDVPVQIGKINELPRDFVDSQNAVDIATTPYTILMSSRGAYGLDWTVVNNDSTATNSLTVNVDGVQYLIAGGGIVEAHTNEPFNSIQITGLSTKANVRVAGKKL